MNKQKWLKVQVKTVLRCDTTSFELSVCIFQVFHLEIETREAGRTQPQLSQLSTIFNCTFSHHCYIYIYIYIK